MTVALVVGHRMGRQGASAGGVTEWAYNSIFAPLVATELRAQGIPSVIVERPDRRGGYSELPKILNELAPKLILSLHLNAATPSATGTTVLYWHSSSLGRELAEILSSQIAAALELRDRGAVPRLANDRGGPLLARTRAPAVIIEPGFVSNDGDRAALIERQGFYATAIAEGVAEVYPGLA